MHNLATFDYAVRPLELCVNKENGDLQRPLESKHWQNPLRKASIDVETWSATRFSKIQ